MHEDVVGNISKHRLSLMVYILMGVSGTGKSTVGELLARRLGIPFYDADDFHSQNNILKMTHGMPLNDGDRMPWLSEISSKIAQWNMAKGAVLACSALKEEYRRVLSDDGKNQITFIHLDGNRELIRIRLESRKNHFFNPILLESQFTMLQDSLHGIKVDIDSTPEEICMMIIVELQRKGQMTAMWKPEL